MKMNFVGKAYRSGDTLVLSIPKNIREVLKLENGDYVKVEVEKIKAKRR